MEDTGVHYLACDPETMWQEMMQIYMEEGGDVLFPGDEKSILLRCVQQILVLAYAAHDHAARMRTLRYAVGEYLDLIGESMRAERTQAKAAQSTIRVTMRGTGGTVSIPQGTQFSYSGLMTFETTQDAAAMADTSGVAMDIPIACTQTGTAGNGFEAGSLLSPIRAAAEIVRVELLETTAGGCDAESDEDYRERLLTGNYANTTTGPADQYAAHALATDSRILDASAVSDERYDESGTGLDYGLGAGDVLISLLLPESMAQEDREDVLEQVKDALSAKDVRPLTDHVIVREAQSVPFSLTVRYAVGETRSTATYGKKAALEAAEAFVAWQCGALGRAFDPYRLTSMLYAAGCTRVDIDSSSSVAGGEAGYTRIMDTQYMLGTVNMQEITDA